MWSVCSLTGQLAMGLTGDEPLTISPTSSHTCIQPTNTHTPVELPQGRQKEGQQCQGFLVRRMSAMQEATHTAQLQRCKWDFDWQPEREVRKWVEIICLMNWWSLLSEAPVWSTLSDLLKKIVHFPPSSARVALLESGCTQWRTQHPRGAN